MPCRGTARCAECLSPQTRKQQVSCCRNTGGQRWLTNKWSSKMKSNEQWGNKDKAPIFEPSLALTCPHLPPHCSDVYHMPCAVFSAEDTFGGFADATILQGFTSHVTSRGPKSRRGRQLVISCDFLRFLAISLFLVATPSCARTPSSTGSVVAQSHKRRLRPFAWDFQTKQLPSNKTTRTLSITKQVIGLMCISHSDSSGG